MEVDDVWTGNRLGNVALGYYSRAYTFATYPSRIVATPIYTVAGGTYAELKEDRQRLSKAFFRVNAFILRTGFLAAGLLALIAPEFIRLALGASWLPMLEAFRLMLVFTLFDPLKMTIADLFIAVGQPEKVVRTRAIQLVILLVGLYTMGPLWGLTGVALAVDLMLVIGIVMLLWQARAYVDFSLVRLMGVPLLAVGLGLLLGWLAASIPGIQGSDWYTAVTKFIVFCLVYGGTLFALEYRQMVKMILLVASLLGVDKRYLQYGDKHELV
jgi:O-antigen/teichoic acid export membrane protein